MDHAMLKRFGYFVKLSNDKLFTNLENLNKKMNINPKNMDCDSHVLVRSQFQFFIWNEFSYMLA